MKENIHYDPKFRGLVIVISEDELKNLAQRECETGGRPNLLDERISHVTYQPPAKESDGKQNNIFTLGMIALSLFWAVCFILIILGVLKSVEILAKWVI